MPVKSFPHEQTLESELKAQISSRVAKVIYEKFEYLSFSIDQKMIAAQYFLGCLEKFDFDKLNEALISRNQKMINHTISFEMPAVYCNLSLRVRAKPAYQFLLNLLVDGILGNLVGITDILGKVIAEVYGFGSQGSSDYLHTVRDFMADKYSASPVTDYLQNNFPAVSTDPFYWINTLKKIRNEVEHRDVCDIGRIHSDQPFGGYGVTNRVKLYLDTRFFKSGTLDDEREILTFVRDAVKKMHEFVDTIYQLLAREVSQSDVPI